MAPSSRNARIIVTVTGSDHPVIVAAVTTLLASVNANIEDISQTIVSELFTMIMIVNIGAAKFEDLKKGLDAVGAFQGVRITAQHEDIFRYMHRV